MKTENGILFSALFAAFLMLPAVSPAHAVDISARDSAGVEEQRFQQEPKLEEQSRVSESKLKALKSGLEEESAEMQPLPEGTRFQLKDIRIRGNAAVSEAELKAEVADLLNREASFSDLQAIAAKIKKIYRSRGYVAVYVYLPPQDIEGGVVEYRVLEGELGEISIEGNRWFSDRVIRRRLHLTPRKVVRYGELKSALLALNKHRDIKARAVLKPGSELKTTDLQIHIKDRFPVHLSTDVNNLGTRNTGRTRWGIGLTHTNLLGLMDQASGRFQIGRGAWAVGSDYNLPVTPRDTRLGFNYSRAAVDLGGDFKALDVEGDATTYGIYLLQPVLSREKAEISLNTGLDWKSIENKVLGEQAGRDELRILNAGANLELNDAWGRTFFPHSFHFGFDSFLGASDKVDENASRLDTGGQFFVYRTSLTRYQKLPADMILSVRSSLQLSPDRLPPSEQLRLGGAFSVRGYQEGEYLADNGAFMAAEIFIPSYFFPEDWKLPFSSRPLRQQIQGVAFFDFGGGAVRHSGNTETSHRTMAGAGIGLRAHLFDRVYARLQWATPVGSGSTNSTDTAFYYGVSAELI